MLSHINYFIMIWGYQRNIITSNPKNVMQIITLNTYNSYIESLFNNLKLLKIEDNYVKVTRIKKYFKYIHKQLPPNLLNWRIIPSINIHNYNTRVKDNIHTVRANHEFAMKCLRYSLPHTINETPDAIKNKTLYTHSLHGFICYIKTCLLNNYNDVCTLSSCYICQLNQYIK